MFVIWKRGPVELEPRLTTNHPITRPGLDKRPTVTRSHVDKHVTLERGLSCDWFKAQPITKQYCELCAVIGFT